MLDTSHSIFTKLLFFFFYCLTVLALLSFFASWHTANAKSLPQEQSADANKIFNQLPAEMQEEIIKESEQVFNECGGQSSKRISYYDCECLAAKFFEQRVIQGPDPKKGHLVYQVYSQCPNDAGMAALEYEKCVDEFVFITPDFEEKCTCYANKMAEFFKKSASLNPEYRTALIIRSRNECELSRYPRP